MPCPAVNRMVDQHQDTRSVAGVLAPPTKRGHSPRLSTTLKGTLVAWPRRDVPRVQALAAHRDALETPDGRHGPTSGVCSGCQTRRPCKRQSDEAEDRLARGVLLRTRIGWRSQS